MVLRHFCAYGSKLKINLTEILEPGNLNLEHTKGPILQNNTL